MLKVLIILFINCAVVIANHSTALPEVTESPSLGRTIYKILLKNSLLEDYMGDLVEEVGQNLVMAAEKWDGCQVNGHYRLNYVNIYLIDSRRLSKFNVLSDFGINLRRVNLERNALTDEVTNIIFVDSNLLKEFIAYVNLNLDEKFMGLKAAAFIRLKGLSECRKYWDPALNNKLNAREVCSESWLTLFRGMLGFILGHEMGHIYMGKQYVMDEISNMYFTSREDRDYHWACSKLVGSKYKSYREIEVRADTFSVNLIGRILNPPGTCGKQFFWYELGANMYLMYILRNQTFDTFYATKSNNIKRMFKYQLGPDLYEDLESSGTGTGRGSVQVFVPKTHPEVIIRAERILGKLHKHEYSHYYGEPANPDLNSYMSSVRNMCDNLERKYGQQE